MEYTIQTSFRYNCSHIITYTLKFLGACYRPGHFCIVQELMQYSLDELLHYNYAKMLSTLGTLSLAESLTSSANINGSTSPSSSFSEDSFSKNYSLSLQKKLEIATGIVLGMRWLHESVHILIPFISNSFNLSRLKLYMGS
jgi:hypothetical protein